MQPLSAFGLAERLRIRGVLTDIDDTLTSEGQLTPEAYDALGRLREAGFLVVPITGRPAGWCDHIARMWPVDAVVGENGAFYFRYDAKARKLEKRFLDDEATRAGKRARLKQLADRILAAVPGAALASDQLYRESDLAIDFCEDVPPLPAAAVDRIVALFEEAGCTAKISSIHVNGWFGDYDKLATTRRLMAECFAVALEREPERYVFIGDSPNDAPMFAFFPHAVGVANVVDFATRLTHEPAYITERRCGAGFRECIDFLLGVTSRA